MRNVYLLLYLLTYFFIPHRPVVTWAYQITLYWRRHVAMLLRQASHVAVMLRWRLMTSSGTCQS